jgi:redox-regulated HSP33 family molecular chaperone
MITVDRLINQIYEDNYYHIDFMENMANGDCDCNIHNLLNMLITLPKENA